MKKLITLTAITLLSVFLLVSMIGCATDQAVAGDDDANGDNQIIEIENNTAEFECQVVNLQPIAHMVRSRDNVVSATSGFLNSKTEMIEFLSPTYYKDKVIDSLEQYDDAFFAEHTVVLMSLRSPVGFLDYTAEDISFEDNTIILRYDGTRIEDCGTSFRGCLFVFPKAAINENTKMIQSIKLFGGENVIIPLI